MDSSVRDTLVTPALLDKSEQHVKLLLCLLVLLCSYTKLASLFLFFILLIHSQCFCTKESRR